MKSLTTKFSATKMDILFACLSTLFLFASEVNAQFEFEPNDSFDDAYTINFDSVYEAAIFQTGDVDFYELFVPMGAVLEFNSLQLPNNLEMRATIYNCTNELLCELTTLNLVENATIYYKVCTSGMYYIKIFDAGNNESSQSHYGFGVTIDSTDMCEFNGCNDVITNACMIETNQPIQAAINSLGDADYYKFDVPVESVINIQVDDLAPNLEVDMILYDSEDEFNGELNDWSSSNAGTFNVYWKVCSPGTYYLKLFDNGNNDRSSQLYNMLVTIDSTDMC